jgi:hypothetical protein
MKWLVMAFLPIFPGIARNGPKEGLGKEWGPRCANYLLVQRVGLFCRLKRSESKEGSLPSKK